MTKKNQQDDNQQSDRTDPSTTEAQGNKLDNGYSEPSDSRTDPEPKLNTPGGDFEDLKETSAARPDQPLDNTPAGQALGHSDGRDMSQREGIEEVGKDT